MSEHKQWKTALTPEEAVERLAHACAALDKIANYTIDDEAYFGNTGEFAKAALDMVMAPAKPAVLFNCLHCGKQHQTVEECNACEASH